MGLFNALVSGSFLPFSRRSNRETDYETVLSRLETDIQSVQSRLTQIRLRERRASVTLTLQAFLLWAIYTFVCWFFGLLSLRHHRHNAEGGWVGNRKLVVWVPVLVSPILIISTRRIVRWWYRRIGAAEDKHLIDLRRQKREKIDEIKRATKYDHLRMLLDKYDEAAPKQPETPVKGKPNSKNATPTKSPAAIPPQQQRPVGAPAPATPETAALQAQKMAQMRQQPRPPLPIAPLQKTWTDKLADAILGSDPSILGPEQKYALICSRCFHHNGLALKEEFNEIQYVCPHCGNFNSRRPSSTPVGSPFNHSSSGAAAGRNSVMGAAGGGMETPSKPGKGAAGGSRLKLRADASDDDEEESEDDPPKRTFEEEHQETTKADESPRDARLKSLRARKSTAKGEGMELDDD